MRSLYLRVVSPALEDKLSLLKPATSSKGGSGSGLGSGSYVGWHIRTVDPIELKGHHYNATRQTYMIIEPPSVVCPVFEDASVRLQASCPAVFSGVLEVFISANRLEFICPPIKENLQNRLLTFRQL